MASRGRQSAAALALVPPRPERPDDARRPAPPDDLTEQQAEEWRAIVARCPADWFPRETYALLGQYCRHVVSARWLGKLLDQFEREPNVKLDEYERVSKLVRAESAILASLATKMRLSQHASYDRKKSKGPTIATPWQE